MWLPFLISALTFAVGAEMAQDPFVEWLSRAGSLGLLAAGVVAFLRGWIVSGASYERMREERDRALELVYRQAELAERALAAAEKKR